MPKKTDKNALTNDRYNDSTPQEVREERLAELAGGEEESFCGADMDEYYGEGLAFLRQHGYRMIPDLTGEFCYHKILKRAKLKRHDNEGYSPDKGFYTWQNISLEDFNKVKRLLMEFIDGHYDPRNCSRLWGPVYSPTVERNKPIYALAMRRLLMEQRSNSESTRHNDGISLTASTRNEISYPVYKWCPQEEWFAPRIKELKPKDMLSILPEAEIDMTMLLLGRAMVGRNSSITTEGVEISHSFRSMGIMVGRSAGLGKSTLMDSIIEAMRECGYSVSIFQNIGSRFGWGEIVSADLAYNDDLTPKSQKQLITSDLTKSIVSGGCIKTERKGVDAIDTRAKCVMLCNSNDYAKQDFFKMDSGLKSRIKMLATHSAAKLDSNMEILEGTASEGTPSLRLKEHWEYLCEKYNTSKVVIALWLLKLSVDRFLEAISLKMVVETRVLPQAGNPNEVYRKSDIAWEYTNEPGTNPLVETVYSITRRLQIQVDKDATKDFINFWRFCWANSKTYGQDFATWKRKPEPVAQLLREKHRRGKISLKILSSLLTALLKEYKALTDNEVLFALKKDYENHADEFWHPYMCLSNIRFDMDTINKAINEIGQSHSMNTEEAKVFERVFHHFTSTDGFRLIGSLTAITMYWDNAIDLDPKLQATYKRLEANTNIPICFIELIDVIRSEI